MKSSDQVNPLSRRIPNPRGGFYSMGPHTHAVPMALFALNRRRLVQALKESGELPENAVVLLQVMKKALKQNLFFFKYTISF